MFAAFRKSNNDDIIQQYIKAFGIRLINCT